MDRKVIVLSPHEWDSRIGLGNALQQAYDHTHFAVTRIVTVNSAIYGILHSLKHGAEENEIMDQLNELLILTGGVTTEIRATQEIIGGVSTVIRHDLKQNGVAKVK